MKQFLKYYHPKISGLVLFTTILALIGAVFMYGNLRFYEQKIATILAKGGRVNCHPKAYCFKSDDEWAEDFRKGLSISISMTIILPLGWFFISKYWLKASIK